MEVVIAKGALLILLWLGGVLIGRVTYQEAQKPFDVSDYNQGFEDGWNAAYHHTYSDIEVQED